VAEWTSTTSLPIFFGGGGGGRRHRGPRRTKNIEHVLRVTLQELYLGTTKKMKVSRTILCVPCGATGSTDKRKSDCHVCGGSGTQEIVRNFGMGLMRQMITCQSCGGQGYKIPRDKLCQLCRGSKIVKAQKIFNVEIEKGMRHGKHIKFAGEADEEPGCQTGDLVFIIQELKHEIFTREGDNLIIQKQIPLANALTGFSFQLQHLDGKKILIQTTPNMIIQPDSVLEVLDQGMPIPNYPFEFGSLLVKFSVVFPTKLNNNQIEKLKTSLPDLIPAPNVDADAIKVELQQVDNRKQQERKEQYRDRGNDDGSDEEEYGHRGQNVQCAQQ